MPKTSTKGLEFFNLSTEWKHGMPQWPSKANMNIKIREFHAKDGLQTLEYEGIMHRGTHMDAPIHVLENTPFITDYETWRFFGTGVVVSIPKGKWGVVTPEDLEKARPKIQPGDIVMVNTGSHRNWGDNPDYFAYSPGL
ncbi:MAG TPA: cyclase family protein, partial [Stellaceae bacterium]|nr:cyclase family protein [Stellaceae bacterium]